MKAARNIALHAGHDGEHVERGCRRILRSYTAPELAVYLEYPLPNTGLAHFRCVQADVGQPVVVVWTGRRA